MLEGKTEAPFEFILTHWFRADSDSQKVFLFVGGRGWWIME